MEAEIDEGGNDEDTKKYLLTTFTASALGAACGSASWQRLVGLHDAAQPKLMAGAAPALQPPR